MAQGTGDAGTHVDSRREERAHRILDAASELVLRWGYDKTTIDDVARTAGVAKGTIYLHWNTREALFAALLRRDRAAMLAAVRSGVAGDPAGATLRGLVRYLGLALMERPLMRAVFLSDVGVLGKLVRAKPNSETNAALRPSLERYLETLREHGAVRTDLSVAEQVTVMMGTTYGFFLLAPLMPADYAVPDERLAELLAETVHRGLASDHDISGAEAEAIAKATFEHLDYAVRVTRNRAQESLDAAGRVHT